MKQILFFATLIFISACTFSNVEDELNELSPTLQWSNEVPELFDSYKSSGTQLLETTPNNGFLTLSDSAFLQYNEMGTLTNSIPFEYNIRSIKRLKTNGYLALAYEDNNLIVIKFDENLNQEWVKIHAAAGVGNKIVEFNDQFIIGGFSSLLKLDSDGNLLWRKVFDRPEINKIITTSDNHIVLVGQVKLSTTVNANNTKAWIAKINTDGLILWENTFGSDGIDHSLGVHETAEENYIMLVNTAQKTGDFKDIDSYYAQNIIVTINKNDGSINNIKGINSNSNPNLFLKNNDGEFLIIGVKSGRVGGVGGPAQDSNILMKVDETGKRKWELAINILIGEVLPLDAKYTTDNSLLLLSKEEESYIQYKLNPEN